MNKFASNSVSRCVIAVVFVFLMFSAVLGALIYFVFKEPNEYFFDVTEPRKSKNLEKLIKIVDEDIKDCFCLTFIDTNAADKKINEKLNNKSNEKLNNKSNEKLNNKSTEIPNKKSTEIPNKKTTEIPNIKSTEIPNKKTNETPNKKSTEIPNKKTNNETNEKNNKILKPSHILINFVLFSKSLYNELTTIKRKCSSNVTITQENVKELQILFTELENNIFLEIFINTLKKWKEQETMSYHFFENRFCKDVNILCLRTYNLILGCRADTKLYDPDIEQVALYLYELVKNTEIFNDIKNVIVEYPYMYNREDSCSLSMFFCRNIALYLEYNHAKAFGFNENCNCLFLPFSNLLNLYNKNRLTFYNEKTGKNLTNIEVIFMSLTIMKELVKTRKAVIYVFNTLAKKNKYIFEKLNFLNHLNDITCSNICINYEVLHFGYSILNRFKILHNLDNFLNFDIYPPNSEEEKNIELPCKQRLSHISVKFNECGRRFPAFLYIIKSYVFFFDEDMAKNISKKD